MILTQEEKKKLYDEAFRLCREAQFLLMQVNRRHIMYCLKNKVDHK